MSSFNLKTRIFSSFTPKSEFLMTSSADERRKLEEKKNALSCGHRLESKNREKRWVMAEHLRQIESLEIRVVDVGSRMERKKKA